MSFKVARGKKFQPRIPRDQLLEMINNELQVKGVEHKSQSQLMLEIANEIYSNDRPIFAQLRGKATVRDTEAWSRAFSLVNNFLHEYGMNNSLEAIEIELFTARRIKHNKKVDGKNAFKDVLSNIKSKKQPFEERVKEWKKKYEESNPQPAFVKPTVRDLKKSTPILVKSPITQKFETKKTPQPKKSPLPKAEVQHVKPAPRVVINSPPPEPKETELEVIMEDDYDYDDFVVESNTSSLKQNQKEDKSLSSSSSEENIPLSKQSMFNQPIESSFASNNKNSFNTSDGDYDFVTESSALKQEQKKDSFAFDDSFIEESISKENNNSIIAVESSKQSIEDASTIIADQSSQSDDIVMEIDDSDSVDVKSKSESVFIDDFEESSKVNVQQVSSDDDISIDDDQSYGSWDS